MSPPLAAMSAKEGGPSEPQEMQEDKDSKFPTLPAAAGTNSQHLPSSVVAVPANLRSCGPVRVPDEAIVPRRPASAGEKGQGWPYAPQDWPNPGDVWTWRVGHRSLNNDYWQDRYLIAPRSFLKERERSLEFASKKSLKEYLMRHYREVNIEEFFESFQWRVPSSKSPGSGKRGGDHARRERLFGVDSNAGKKPKKRCKADNASCPLELSHSTGQAPGVSICEICCAEPDFCRECKCIICCRVIEADDREVNMIRCGQRSSGGAACGHAAHLDCALEAELAGVVKKSGIDMEYLCRRCDRKSDLRDLVTRLLESIEKTESEAAAEKVLRRVLRVLQGTLHGTFYGGNGGRVLEILVQETLQQIQKGVGVQKAFKSLTAQVVRHQNSGRNVSLPPEGMHQSEASLDQWLPVSNTPASLRTTATLSSLTSPWEKDSPPAVSSGLSERLEGLRRAVDVSNAGDTSGGLGLSEADDLRTATQLQVYRADPNTVAGSQRDFSVDDESCDNPPFVERSLSEGKLYTQGSVSSRFTPAGQKHPKRCTSVAGSGLSLVACLAPSPHLGGLPVSHTPLQLLESKLDGQIHEALQKLRETQAAEFKCAEAQLLERKFHLTRAARRLDQDRRKSEIESLGDDDAIHAQLHKLQESEEEFNMMLKVSDGFSSIPGDTLRKLFGWPALD